MVRMNITMPDRVAQKLSKFKNKSRFIAEALEEKLARDEKILLEEQLIAAYKKSAKEELRLCHELEGTTGDGIE